MSFNVNEFRASMVQDGARPNQFEVVMAFPTIISSSTTGAEAAAGIATGGGVTNETRMLTFHARSSQLPESQIGTAVQHYFGREIKFPGDPTFTEWTITVINDENFTTRNAFERWMQALRSNTLNLRAGNALSSFDYSSDGLVRQFGKTGNVLKEYKFVGMFPVNLSAIELDWGQNDEIETYQVTFAYQWWESPGITESI